jgi:hypothetical protein
MPRFAYETTDEYISRLTRELNAVAAELDEAKGETKTTKADTVRLYKATVKLSVEVVYASADGPPSEADIIEAADNEIRDQSFAQDDLFLAFGPVEVVAVSALTDTWRDVAPYGDCCDEDRWVNMTCREIMDRQDTGEDT